jgi:AAA+ ATPase superfamily predicted ATPase
MFLDRTQELAFLHSVLTRTHPGPGQFLMIYGRRRIGKTALLRHWVEQSGLPFTYWVAEKEPALLQRRRFFAHVLRADPTSPTTPTYDSWSDLWRAAATVLANKRHILVIDELPYAAEADGAMLSALQHAWDQYFESSQSIVVICGSQVRAMELLLGRQSPIYGRLTGQWLLRPLPFGTLRAFFPAWSPAEQVAAYAVVGGVPAYLRWLDPAQTLVENIRQLIQTPGGMALSEVELLLADEVREPRTYLAILQAIGSGHHTLDAIANASLVGKNHLSAYLKQLEDLKLVERRVPITIRPALRDRSKQGRYHLRDPFFRFYFRFLYPHAVDLSYAPERVLPAIQSGLRAFVGATMWEELARAWIDHHYSSGVLPFTPEYIGSHWSRRVQVDVVAINWQTREILLGECKWGDAAVDRQPVRDLIERTIPLTLADLPSGGTGWQVHPALFARAGATPAARETLRAAGGMLVDLPSLFADLAEA